MGRKMSCVKSRSAAVYWQLNSLEVVSFVAFVDVLVCDHVGLGLLVADRKCENEAEQSGENEKRQPHGAAEL
jgi:hypothetical protein